MSLVILQPAGNQGGREHYVDTIENLVSIKSCEAYVAPQVFRMLKDTHPSGKAGMWGVVTGKGDINVKKWEKIGIGDVVLFAADKKIKAIGTVSTKFVSERLAKQLWGTDKSGSTWKYMYSLDEIKTIELSYQEFNKVVGYKSNNIIQGFTVMDEEKSSRFLDHFAFRSQRHIEEISDEEFDQALKALDGDLDRKATSWHRKEQAKARKMLLNGRMEGVCQLCQRTVASEFLIAAHIKRRSECSDDEKRDVGSVMMLACKFGCDYLFEAGHVSVDQSGQIIISRKLTDEVALKYVSQIKDKRIVVKNSQLKYFEWHFKNRFLR